MGLLSLLRRLSLRDDGTPLSEVFRRYPQMTDLEIRSHLAQFLFRGGEVEKSVAALSGGERARLSLALLVLTKPTWLAMDEPTNHLDLAGRTALEEMLGNFQGALVCISHDREFLDGLTTHTWEVADGTVEEFEGNYSAWHKAREERATEAAQERQRQEQERKRQEQARAEKEARKAQAASKPKKPKNPWKLERLEARIMELETQLESLNAALTSEEIYKDSDKLRDTQFQIAEVERELEEANAEWESFA